MNDSLIVSIIALLLLVYNFILGFQKSKVEKKLREKESELQDAKSKELQENSDRLGRKYRDMLDTYRGSGPEGNA